MSPVKKHAVEQIAVQDSICTIDLTSASDDCSIFPDAAGSLKIATTKETTNQFLRPNVTGNIIKSFIFWFIINALYLIKLVCVHGCK